MGARGAFVNKLAPSKEQSMESGQVLKSKILSHSSFEFLIEYPDWKSVFSVNHMFKYFVSLYVSDEMKETIGETRTPLL